MSDIPAFSAHAHTSLTIAAVDVATGSTGEFKSLVAERSEALIHAYLNKRDVPLPNGETRKASDLFSTRVQYNGDAIQIQLEAKTRAWRDALLPQMEQMGKKFLTLLPEQTSMKQKFAMLAALVGAKMLTSKDEQKKMREQLFENQEAFVVFKSMMATAQGWIDENGVERVTANAIQLQAGLDQAKKRLTQLRGQGM